MDSVDKLRLKPAPSKNLSMKFQSVREACGKVPGDVIVKAQENAGLPEESYRMVKDVFVHGFRQAVVARRIGVSRQRVNKVCKTLLGSTNHLMQKKDRQS